jgi:hypothetical protein
MGADDPAYVFRSKVRGGELAALKQIIKDGVDFEEVILKPSETQRQWTPLHIAAWGTMKPQYDKDIVELILQAAAKKGGEAKVRDAKCAVDGETPLDLAKQRLQKTPETEEYLDERKKIEKIVEWIEKGLPTG